MRRFSLGLACLCLLAAALAGEQRPDVVLILADDLGYADLSSYGSRKVRTPHIDRLAEQGVRLTRFYTSSPECTPARTALLTGRYPQRAGGLECAIGVGNVGRYDDAIRLAAQGDLGLPADMTVLPSALAALGYRSALIGKWHLGYEPKFHPLEHGFGYFFGIIGGNADYFHHVESSSDPARPGDHVLYRGRDSYRDDRYLTHLITDETVRWLEQVPSGKPFFLYVPYTAPHNPQQGPGDRRDAPLAGADFNRRNDEAYRQVIEELDQGVGEVMAALARLGRDHNTIVIFTSDNGPVGVGETQPFQGLKGTVYEGGIRVPCIIRWPGRLEAGSTSDQPSILTDITYSILEHTGAGVTGRQLDGRDFLGHLLKGEAMDPRTLFWRYRRGARTRKAVLDGDLKLIENFQGSAHELKLFDLSADPGESQDLSVRRPGEVRRLRTMLAEWEADVTPVR